MSSSTPPTLKSLCQHAVTYMPFSTRLHQTRASSKLQEIERRIGYYLYFVKIHMKNADYITIQIENEKWWFENNKDDQSNHRSTNFCQCRAGGRSLAFEIETPAMEIARMTVQYFLNRPNTSIRHLIVEGDAPVILEDIRPINVPRLYIYGNPNSIDNYKWLDSVTNVAWGGIDMCSDDFLILHHPIFINMDFLEIDTSTLDINANFQWALWEVKANTAVSYRKCYSQIFSELVKRWIREKRPVGSNFHFPSNPHFTSRNMLELAKREHRKTIMEGKYNTITFPTQDADFNVIFSNNAMRLCVMEKGIAVPFDWDIRVVRGESPERDNKENSSNMET